MKNNIYLTFVSLILILGVSCSPSPKTNYVTFSGTITNPKSDSLLLIPRVRTLKSKVFRIDENGIFKDTLKINNSLKALVPNYVLSHGKEMSWLYLKNGSNLRMTLNTDQFDETISYSGMGSAENNYLAEITLIREKFTETQKVKNIFDLDEEEFYNSLDLKMTADLDRLLSIKGLDSTFISSQKTALEYEKKNMVFTYKVSNNLLTYEEYHDSYGKTNAGHLSKGKPSPIFKDYENFLGGTTSLTDFKGQYVYVDIWATWCVPCKAEIPYLKDVEEAYHNKNIAFVSISVDKNRDREKWQNMVEETSLGGIQLFADQDFKSDFVKKYEVNSIPRFILIDPDGNIVDANAPRPSYRLALDELLKNEGIL